MGPWGGRWGRGACGCLMGLVGRGPGQACGVQLRCLQEQSMGAVTGHYLGSAERGAVMSLIRVSMVLVWNPRRSFRAVRRPSCWRSSARCSS